MCCSFTVDKVALTGSAKGSKGWVTIDTANVYYDEPYHAQLDHTLNIDFVCETRGATDRVAIELSPTSARELVKMIMVALEKGEAAEARERAAMAATAAA